MENSYKPINWNVMEDIVDKLTWEKLVEQFWTDTRIPVSNDLDDWRKMTETEKWLVNHVFGGLTLLDTLQSEAGVDSLKESVRTQKETAVYNNIEFMESIHAKSYSTIFSTLCTKHEIEQIFAWAENDEHLQYKATVINEVYKNGTSLQKKIASVFLESFLFYSGFYTPLRYAGMNKLANVSEIIKLIVRDESVHGTFIGYKFQKEYEELPEDEQLEVFEWAIELLYDLYDNEGKYTQDLYDEIGWTEDVMVFLRYNANKALQNLGFEPVFEDTAEDVNPIVMNGLSTTSSVHDFFSSVGNSYLVGKVEAMKDSDYDY